MIPRDASEHIDMRIGGIQRIRRTGIYEQNAYALAPRCRVVEGFHDIRPDQGSCLHVPKR